MLVVAPLQFGSARAWPNGSAQSAKEPTIRRRRDVEIRLDMALSSVRVF
jgi:hypothetical protein